MQEKTPRISLSINRSVDGSKATGDLNSLSLGFGLFQVWLYMAVFGASKLFTASTMLPGFPYLPEELGPAVLYSFLIANGIALIALGLTNQIFLNFFVTKRALAAATALCSVGTGLLFATCVEGIGFAMAIVSGTVMGIGSSLLLVLWGTAFARFQFATIILNTAVASVLGVAVSLICANWVPSPISSLVTILLPVAAAPVLRSLMPAPFYRRHTEPIFHPLKKAGPSFFVRFGIPVLIIGVPLGALRMVCVGEILPSGSITIQLLLGAACAISIVIYIIAIALTKRDMFWDTLYRCVIPISMLGLACVALLPSDLILLGGFCASTGFICLDILMWVFFAGVAQEFRISPIFVFGIGRGLLEIGSGFGSALAPSAINPMIGETSAIPFFALAMIVVLSIGYALLPRYRELKAMIDKDQGNIERAVASKDMAEVKDISEIASSNNDEPNVVIIQEVFEDIYTGSKGASHIPESSTDSSLPSFDQTGENSVSSHEMTEADAKRIQKEKGSFYRRCEEISSQFVLSRRETEVFFLLAKGHNAAFIQEKLCVSKSTAKTHINHIYKKLDIHTQQELLNMVEDRPRGPKDADEKTKQDHLFNGAYLGGVIPVDEKEALVQSALINSVKTSGKKHPVKQDIFR